VFFLFGGTLQVDLNCVQHLDGASKN